jgi:hypothetical protein
MFKTKGEAYAPPVFKKEFQGLKNLAMLKTNHLFKRR